MPKSTRDIVKLKHDQILLHLEHAIAYADELHEMYKGPHPDYAEGYENICMIIAQAAEFTEKMKSFI